MTEPGWGALGIVLSLTVVSVSISRVRDELAGIREELARLRKMVP